MKPRWLALLTAAAVPLVGVAMPAPDEVRIPMLKPREKGDPKDAALFSHSSHNAAHCYRCHPSLFPQRPLGFTHDDMDAGKFCGACHDGKTAWHVDGNDVACETCHVEGP